MFYIFPLTVNSKTALQYLFKGKFPEFLVKMQKKGITYIFFVLCKVCIQYLPTYFKNHIFVDHFDTHSRQL